MIPREAREPFDRALREQDWAARQPAPAVVPGPIADALALPRTAAAGAAVAQVRRVLDEVLGMRAELRAAQAELRAAHRAYGRASQTIGQERAINARLRETIAQAVVENQRLHATTAEFASEMWALLHRDREDALRDLLHPAEVAAIVSGQAQPEAVWTPATGWVREPQRWQVGDRISGEDATEHLPGGTRLRYISPSGLPCSRVERVLDRNTDIAVNGGRGVHPRVQYEILELPGGEA